MPIRNIVLTEHEEELIERLVSSGRYKNASEVLREGLRLVESRDAEERTRLRALRDAARVGVEDVDQGRVRSFDSTTDLRAHLDAVTAKAISEPRAR
jgi:antitoxin ParD1/3/4